eukprot:1585385-Amphidinium_carterae.1
MLYHFKFGGSGFTTGAAALGVWNEAHQPAFTNAASRLRKRGLFVTGRKPELFGSPKSMTVCPAHLQYECKTTSNNNNNNKNN